MNSASANISGTFASSPAVNNAITPSSSSAYLSGYSDMQYR